MTTRKPPGPPVPPTPPPQFEAYRPSGEHSEGRLPQSANPPAQAPRQAPPQQQPAGYPQQPPPQRPLQQMPPQQPPPQQLPPQHGGPRGPQPPLRPLQRGGPPGRRPPPRPSNSLKWVAIGVLVLIGLAAGAAALMFAAGPSALIRGQMIAQVKTKTGRDLTISGPTSFTFYPSIGLQMQDVALSAPPGMATKPFVTMKALDVSVRLMPLFKREVAVERLALREPVFHLDVDKSGRRSWDFAPPGKQAHLPARVQVAQAAAPADAPTITDAPAAPLPQVPATRAAAGLEQLQLKDVRIEKGVVHFADARTGAKQDVSDIDMAVAMPSITGTLDAKGDLVWQGENLDIDGKLTSVKDILEQRPAKLSVTLAGRPLTASYDGALALKEPFEADGAVNVQSASARALAAWLGTKFPPSNGFGAFDLKGTVRTVGAAITITGVTARLDDAKATGDVSFVTGGERPNVKANLKLSELDLNKYMLAPGTAPAAPAKPAAPAAAPSNPAAVPAEKSIEDLLKDEAAPGGPQVKGYTQRGGWSEEPMDLAPLGLVDLDAKLAIGRLLYKQIKVGQSQVSVGLKNRVLKTNFDDVQLYQGKGRGFISVDGTQSRIASIGANLAFDGVDALTLLKDAADLDWLAGKGKLTLAVAGQGANQRQIVDALSGKADLKFADGAIVGINIPGMIRNVGQGKLGGLKTAPSEKTDFSELASTWAIAGGIAQNQDLALVSPLLRVSGAGKILLGARQIDYTMKPKVVADLAGQGGNTALAGLEIPLRITGPWEKPKFEPDLKGLLNDPDKAIDTIKEIGKQFKGKNAKEILDGLLGGGNSPAGQTAPAPDGQAPAPDKPSKTQQLLDKFLKPQ